MGRGPLIYKQRLATRVTHWIWAVCLLFLMFSGLQIFIAHPSLHFGKEAGFDYDNAALEISAVQKGDAVAGVTRILGHEFDTTGTFGVTGGEYRALPAALTMPSGRSLATGRVIHFFFAWVLVGTLTVWLVASVLNGHFRTLIPNGQDLRGLPADVVNHVRLRFHHARDYNVLQKLAYAGVLFVALPLMIATGLTMSPGFNAVAPWLLEVFGGRQSARSIHFIVMLALVAFFVVHMLMIVAAGPLNEIRSIITGWYRTDVEGDHE
ncbi:MAG: cytochrome b/b6 domain-containing protein [Pseudorhodobacter sp.]|nr:cytochrome b/b6 domain-containing protein [Pseudorhodobacter sp.]